MATKRDLVEAHQFSRRRLVAAFLSGAPGGREVEPVRPGRALVGGVAVALLVLAGGAATRLTHDPGPADEVQQPAPEIGGSAMDLRRSPATETVNASLQARSIWPWP